ncbi:HSP70-domain-containing protein [Thozetella sp. PMI_491]|nr:HSP70-domain-containing protein [Thozetella sp. PMI_491]
MRPVTASKFSPSYIAFTENGTLFGEEARLYAQVDPRNTVFGIRQLLGRKFSEIQADIDHLPYKVISKADHPIIQVTVSGQLKEYTAEELSGMMLLRIKEVAGAYTGKKVVEGVITVPFSFNDNQRVAVKKAGEIAKIEVLGLINEGTAAAIAHGLDIFQDERLILVYGLDETLNIDILSSDVGVLECLSNIHDIGIAPYNRNERLSPREHAVGAMNMIESAFGISSRTMVTDIFDDSLAVLESALKDAKISKDQVQELVIIGSSSLIPEIRPLLEQYLGIKASKVAEPADAVVIGAAIQAQVIVEDYESGCSGCNYPIMYGTPFSLGIETVTGVVEKVIKRNTLIPIRKTLRFTTAVDNQTTVVVKVYEGERLLARHNFLLGQFELEIHSAPRGRATIEISFELDWAYQLNVTALDVKSGKKKSTRLDATPELRHSAETYDYIFHEAEVHQSEDDALRKLLQPTLEVGGRR